MDIGIWIDVFPWHPLTSSCPTVCSCLLPQHLCGIVILISSCNLLNTVIIHNTRTNPTPNTIRYRHTHWNVNSIEGSRVQTLVSCTKTENPPDQTLACRTTRYICQNKCSTLKKKLHIIIKSKKTVTKYIKRTYIRYLLIMKRAQR